MRGPGEFFGTRQAGVPSFQVANLIRDRQLLEAAKREAAGVLAGPNKEISQEEINRASASHAHALAKDVWAGGSRVRMRRVETGLALSVMK